MDGTEAGVEAEDGVELLEDVFAESEEFGIGGQGHRDRLLCRWW
jgi:hypothetical protein